MKKAKDLSSSPAPARLYDFSSVWNKFFQDMDTLLRPISTNKENNNFYFLLHIENEVVLRNDDFMKGGLERLQLAIEYFTTKLYEAILNTIEVLWVLYKESSWIIAILWVAFLIGLGSIGTSVFIVAQLFRLSHLDLPHFGEQ